MKQHSVVCEPAHIISHILPAFQKLVADEQDSVRLLLVEQCVQLRLVMDGRSINVFRDLRDAKAAALPSALTPSVALSLPPASVPGAAAPMCQTSLPKVSWPWK
jgi:hypothetical protein